MNTLRKFNYLRTSLLSLTVLSFASYVSANRQCLPLTTSDILTFYNQISFDANSNEIVNLRLRLAEDFKGKIWLNDTIIQNNSTQITATLSDTVIILMPILEANRRECVLTSQYPIKKKELIRVDIPKSLFEISPDYIEVDDIDIDEELLSTFSVAGAWHKNGYPWTSQGMFSIIDDDSLDGQIKSSSKYGNQGYYSLLYPVLESLGLKGNLAVEGRRTGLSQDPPEPNDNLRTIIRLQNEKGWDILSHSMTCLGEILNNWMVDSLDSPLAKELLAIGPNNGADASTISVYDNQTRKQYWPNPDNTGWVETPSRFVKPYIGDYTTKREVMYNADYDVDWHWGEWKRIASEFGVNPKGFVTHNSTSSHLLLPGILKYFPQGFSDLSTKNINTSPLFSSAVRAGLEGQSLKDYDGNSNDNSFNQEHFKAFCELIDQAAECGGWIMFNLHTYRNVWNNSIKGALVSEGGSYPDEWVIPMKGVDSANAPLTPPEHLKIKDWSEWYPCPGSRLRMMWDILKYAKEKGLINVSASEGFEKMGNKKSFGYFSQGHVFGMDCRPSIGIREKYPHYIVSATDEVYYYNPIITSAISYEPKASEMTDPSDDSHKFIISGKDVYWISPEISGITLKLVDLTGKELVNAHSNHINIEGLNHGVYIVFAIHHGKILHRIKVAN